MGVIVALDGATRTGVAVSEPSSGVPPMRLSSWQAPKARPIQEKIEYLADSLVRLLDGNSVEFVVVEIPQAGVSSSVKLIKTPLGFERQTLLGGQMKTQSQLWAIHGAYLGIIHSRKIPYRSVGVKEWRKAIFGNGNIAGKDAKKESKALCEKFGIHCPNEDAAEAASMLLYLNNNLRRWLAEYALEHKV